MKSVILIGTLFLAHCASTQGLSSVDCKELAAKINETGYTDPFLLQILTDKYQSDCKVSEECPDEQEAYDEAVRHGLSGAVLDILDATLQECLKESTSADWQEEASVDCSNEEQAYQVALESNLDPALVDAIKQALKWCLENANLSAGDNEKTDDSLGRACEYYEQHGDFTFDLLAELVKIYPEKRENDIVSMCNSTQDSDKDEKFKSVCEAYQGTGNINLDTIESELGMTFSEFVIKCADMFPGKRRKRQASYPQDDLLSKTNAVFKGIEVSEKESPLQTSGHICNCAGYKCTCCQHIEEATFELNDTVCVEAAYLPDNYGIEVEILWNFEVLVREEVSAKNPPPICANVPIPKLKDLLDVCVRFHDLAIGEDHFNACLNVSLEVLFIELFDMELGCLHFGNSTSDNMWACMFKDSENDKTEKSNGVGLCANSCNGAVGFSDGLTYSVSGLNLQKTSMKTWTKNNCLFVADPANEYEPCTVGCFKSDPKKGV